MDPHRPARRHYAWVILAVTCLTVVLTAGVTAVPAVLHRWCTGQRGLALGLLGAASSTGRLVFLPLLATIVAALGWQAVGWVVAGCVLLLAVPLVAVLMRDTPAALGLTPYGTAHGP